MAAVTADEPAALESDFSLRKVRIAFACLIGMMLGAGGFATGAVALIMAPVGQEFGWGRGAVGGAVTAMTWASALVLPLVGRYVDKVGARRLVIASAVLMALALMAVALPIASILQFYACFIALGVLGAVSVAYTKVVSTLFSKHRGKALALFAIEASLVSALIPLVMRGLMVQFGWRGIFVGLGLIELLAVAPILVWLMKDPMEEARQAAAVPPALEGLTTAEALRSAPFWMILAASIGGGMAVFGLLPHLVSMMTGRGLTVDAAVGAISVMALFTTLGQLSAGFAMDRIDSAKIAAAYVSLYAFGLLLIMRTTAATGPAPLYIGVALLGLGGGVAPMANYFFTRYFGLRSFAELMGWFRGLLALLTGLSPVIIGLIYDRTGSYGLAFMLLIATTVSSVALLVLLPAYRYAVAVPPPAKPETAS